MAQTSAERQAAYRAKQAATTGERRINTWVATEAFLALAELARRHKLTQRAMLERLIAQAAETEDRSTK